MEFLIGLFIVIFILVVGVYIHLKTPANYRSSGGYSLNDDDSAVSQPKPRMPVLNQTGIVVDIHDNYTSGVEDLRI